MKKSEKKSQPEQPTIPNKPFRFLIFVSKPHVLWFSLAFTTVTIAITLTTISPVIFKFIIDGITNTATHDEQLAVLTKWGTAYVILLGVMWIFWRLSGLTGAQWTLRAAATGYEQLYMHASGHSHGYFADRFAGAVASKIRRAIGGTERFITSFLWSYWQGLLGLIVTVGLMCYADVTIGLIFLALIMVLLAVNIVLLIHRRPFAIRYAEADSKLQGVGVDILSNITAVRQYARRAAELGNIGTAAHDTRKKEATLWQLSELGLIVNNVIIVIALGGMMFVMVNLFRTGDLSAGDIVLILTLVFGSSHTLTFIGNSLGELVRTYGEVEEGLTEVLESHAITDRTNAPALTVPNGAIEFSNVDFKYEGMGVFADFSLKIKPGQRVGLVGPSGAGKSTFVSLLLRQHDIAVGAITIDEQNIAEVTQDSLREHIAIVPQEPALFHRTIRENIAYGKPDATDGEVERAARQAEIHELIMTLPEGYQTLVGERGVKLSGGQRQRVAIARAILKDAPILLLDEATSALDSESEVAIQRALRELMEGKTVIAIAHRLSTLREMDRIIVLDQGAIVEDGTHAELVKAGGLYAGLWQHQAGGFLQE